MTNSTLTSNQKLYAIADNFCGNFRYYDEPVDDSDTSVWWSEDLRLSMCYSSQSAADDALGRLHYNARQNIEDAMNRDPKLRSVTSSSTMFATFSRSIKIICVESGQL